MDKIGIIVGGGAGPELADIFRRVFPLLTTGKSKSEIIECPHRPKSFTEMKDWPVEAFEASVMDDLAKLRAFYLECANSFPKPVVFRTAVNAEALYVLRRELLAIKTIPVEIGSRKLLFIRDETQGFYANEEWSVSESHVEARTTYSLERLKVVLSAGRKESLGWLREGYETWLIYKHHLFANIFCRWAEKLGDIDDLLQPGAAYMKLLQYLETSGKDILIVASNEIADFLHEVLLARDGVPSRDVSIARNIFLHNDFNSLIDYQTVHGSADDIARSGKVNPVATLRAAATIAEREFGHARTIAMMESAIRQAVDQEHLSENLEVRSTTDAIVGSIFDNLTMQHVPVHAFEGI